MDDSIIVKRFLERDETVLSDVSGKYGKYCRTIARNILGNDQDAEEIVQDTLLRLWESIPPNQPKMLKAFIGKIARNLALDAVKVMGALKRGGCETALILDELGEVASSGIGVEEVAEQREMLSAINDFLGGLPDNKRKILVLRYWHCFSISKIAQIMDATESSVSSILKRERKNLSEYMSKRGY